jgi:hypothetical protein
MCSRHLSTALFLRLGSGTTSYGFFGEFTLVTAGLIEASAQSHDHGLIRQGCCPRPWGRSGTSFIYQASPRLDRAVLGSGPEHLLCSGGARAQAAWPPIIASYTVVGLASSANHRLGRAAAAPRGERAGLHLWENVGVLKQRPHTGPPHDGLFVGRHGEELSIISSNSFLNDAGRS